MSGQKFLNISATCILLNTLLRGFKKVNEDLNQMIMAGKDLSYSLVREFVVDFYSTEFADFLIFAAMRAPKNSLWFQN